MYSKRNAKNDILFIPLAILLLVSLACGSGPLPPPIYTSAPPVITPVEETQPGPCRFSSAGNATSGWVWLRDNAFAASGQWDCHGLPTGRDLAINLPTLVTNKSDGGSGYSSPVKVTYTNPTSQLSQTIQVYLQNQLAEQSPANSAGAGYPTTGYFVIPKTYIAANGGLFVQIERVKPNAFHVAVNAKSLNFDRPRFADSFYPSMGIIFSDWYWLRDPAR